MKLIPLTQGKFTKIDDEDFERVSQYKWHYSSKRLGSLIGCVKRHCVQNGKIYLMRLHRFIISVPDDMQVDHIDGDALNNQKSNLRICTPAQNCMNKRFEPKRNTSGFKGVSLHKPTGRWRARVKLDRKERHVGLFDSPIEAARAYDEMAVKCFGVFAKTNEMLGRLPCP